MKQFSSHFKKTFKPFSNVINNVNPALLNFIHHECPNFLQSLIDNNLTNEQEVLNYFNHFLNEKLTSFDNLLNYFENERKKRIKVLQSICRQEFFNQSLNFEYSCVSGLICGHMVLIFFSSACPVSLMTLSTANKLSLDSNINSTFRGKVVGFGVNSQILGRINNVLVYLSFNFMLSIDFVIIEKSKTDLVIIGIDFMKINKIIIDYPTRQIIIPEKFIPKTEIPFSNPSFQQSIMKEWFFQKRAEFGENFLNKSGLLIDLVINSQQVQALIDTASCSCLISQSLAIKLDLLRLLDMQNRKIKRGLGTMLSIGKIPSLPVQFDTETILFIPFEVIKIENLKVIILGLDFLILYNCNLDFQTNFLKISLDHNRFYKFKQANIF